MDLEEELSYGPEEASQWEVPVFERLEARQKIALLAFVGEALLRHDVPSPPLNAVNEATVGVIFEHAKLLTQFEVEFDGEEEEGRYTWRRLVLAASELDKWPPDDPPPTESCTDPDEWELLVEVLANRILWDDDWQDEEVVMDAPPRVADFVKHSMGITEDYYTDIAPDPSDSELQDARKTLNDLTGRTRKF